MSYQLSLSKMAVINNSRIESPMSYSVHFQFNEKSDLPYSQRLANQAGTTVHSSECGGRSKILASRMF